jgi:mRNA interferase RelE/StbE
MVIYQIEISRKAQRELGKLPRKEQERIRVAIDGLATDPRPHGSVKLAGEERSYRIRVGVYRIIYDIYDDVLVIEVVRVGHRQGVYER